MQSDVEFRPIRLPEDNELCLKFTRGAFVCSYGDDTRFFESDGNGPERYLEWLRKKIDENPQSAVHVRQNGRPIGQMELGLFKLDAAIGYVCLYYLVPEARGTGVATLMDTYAHKFLKSLGVTTARLSVTPTNKRAIAFYKKMGWQEMGALPRST